MDPSLVGAGSGAAVSLQHNGSVSGSSGASATLQSTGSTSTDRAHADSPTDVGKMFVGGLNWLTTSESLKDYFSRFGEVRECVIMKTPMTRKSRGFGFVTFTDPNDVDKVLLVANHEVDGKKIDPKVAVPRKNQTAAAKNSIVTRTKKAFVGGVSSNTTPDDLRTYFSTFGPVEDAMLMVDKATQRHRGFGFITFASEDTVDKVCDIHYHEINGKIVECKKAQPREVLTPAHLRTAGRAGFGLGLPFGRPPAAGAYMPFTAYDAAAFGRAGSYPGFGMFPFYPGLPAYLGFYPPMSPGNSPAGAGSSGDYDRRFDYVSKRLEELSLLDQLTNASLAFSAQTNAGRDRPANFASNTRTPNQSAATPANKTLAIRKASNHTETPGAASVFGASNPYKATGVGLHMGEPSSSLEGPGVRAGAPYLGQSPAGSTGLSSVATAAPSGHALNHAGMGPGRNYTASFS